MTVNATAGADAGISSVSTLDASETLNVQAGDYLLVVLGYRGGTLATATVKTSDDALTLSQLGSRYVGNDTQVHAFGLAITGTKNGATIRVGLSIARQGLSFRAYVIRPGSGETVEADVGFDGAYAIESSSAQSQSISPAASSIVFAIVQASVARTFSARQVGGSNADAYTDAVYATHFYRALSSSASGIYATATLSDLSYWACCALSFKATSSGSSPVPKIMQAMNQFAGGALCVR